MYVVKYVRGCSDSWTPIFPTDYRELAPCEVPHTSSDLIQDYASLLLKECPRRSLGLRLICSKADNNGTFTLAFHRGKHPGHSSPCLESVIQFNVFTERYYTLPWQNKEAEQYSLLATPWGSDRSDGPASPATYWGGPGDDSTPLLSASIDRRAEQFFGQVDQLFYIWNRGIYRTAGGELYIHVRRPEADGLGWSFLPVESRLAALDHFRPHSRGAPDVYVDDELLVACDLHGYTVSTRMLAGGSL